MLLTQGKGLAVFAGLDICNHEQFIHIRYSQAEAVKVRAI